MLETYVGLDVFELRQRARQVGDAAVVRRQASDGLATMVEVLGQVDLFGEAPTVLLEDVLSLSADDQKKLASHLLATVVASEQRVVVLLDKAMPAKGELSLVLRQGRVEELPIPTTANLVRWVQQQAEQRKIKVDKSVVPQFVLRFGGDKFSLATELDRLTWSDPAELSAGTLGQMMPMGVEAEVFGITESWAQRRALETLQQLQQLWYQQTAPQYLLALFERQAKLLYLTQLHLESGKSGTALASALGVPGFVANKLSAASKKWQLERLQDSLKQLYELDAAIKTSRIEAEFGLERWVVTSIAGTSTAAQ